MQDTGLLLLRSVSGGLLAGHGAQKLFGAFEGPGLQGTAGFMEALGLQPGRYWGTAAALSEFGGGALTALGLFYPLGPIAVASAMSMATVKAHWGKPIWVTSGGAELPLTNIAVALALTMAGPGRYSLDRLFGIRLPRAVAVMAALTAAAAVAYGASSKPQPAPQTPVETRTTLQGGEDAQASQVDAVMQPDAAMQPEAEQAPAPTPETAPSS